MIKYFLVVVTIWLSAAHGAEDNLNKHQKAHDHIIKNYSCVDAESCRKIKQTLGKQKLEEEFATNDALKEFLIGLKKEDPMAQETLVLLQKNYSQQYDALQESINALAIQCDNSSQQAQLGISISGALIIIATKVALPLAELYSPLMAIFFMRTAVHYAFRQERTFHQKKLEEAAAEMLTIKKVLDDRQK